MTQRGFISPTIMLVIALGCSLLATATFYRLWRSSVNELASFKVAVKVAGDAQETRTKETISRQEGINNATVKTYKARLAGLNTRYERLRSNSARGGELPAVPSTTRPADAGARDQRLLDVLQYADEQTARLIELQDWVKEQAGLAPPVK